MKMKILALIISTLLLTNVSAQKDTSNYDLIKKMKSQNFHEGENFVHVINKYSLYAVMQNGKIKQLYFKQKDGIKYYAHTAENSASSIERIDVFPCQRTPICIETPWGRYCALVGCEQRSLKSIETR